MLSSPHQVTAQNSKSELDKLVTQTDVTKRMSADEVDSHSRDGAYIIGLSMQGARWDANIGTSSPYYYCHYYDLSIHPMFLTMFSLLLPLLLPPIGTVDKSKPKEMFCPMPIITVKGVGADKADTQAYQCPVYKTEQRGPTFVFCAQLKTKSPPARWIMAGVALIMDVSS